MAVMVPLILSHDGAVQRDTVKRRNDFAQDIKVDWVLMAQGVLRDNVVIVGRFFDEGSMVSEAWRNERPEELAEEQDGPPERIETGEERRERQLKREKGCVVVRNETSAWDSADVCRIGDIINKHADHSGNESNRLWVSLVASFPKK